VLPCPPSGWDSGLQTPGQEATLTEGARDAVTGGLRDRPSRGVATAAPSAGFLFLARRLWPRARATRRNSTPDGQSHPSQLQPAFVVSPGLEPRAAATARGSLHGLLRTLTATPGSLTPPIPGHAAPPWPHPFVGLHAPAGIDVRGRQRQRSPASGTDHPGPRDSRVIPVAGVAAPAYGLTPAPGRRGGGRQ